VITLHRYRYQLFIKTTINLSLFNKKKQTTDKLKCLKLSIYSQLILQINETVYRASDSSPSIDDNHSTLSSSSQSDILLTQTSNPSPTRIDVLLTNFKKFYVYFMKTTMLSFHASPVHIVISTICKMGNQR